MTEKVLKEGTEKLLESRLNAEQLEDIINDYIDQNHISYKDLIFLLDKMKFLQMNDLVNGEDEED